MEAAHQKGQDIKKLQDSIAEAVVMEGNVSITNTTVFIPSSFSNTVSVVDIANTKCNCIAASHQKACVCLCVYEKLVSTGIIQAPDSCQTTVSGEENISEAESAASIIERLYLWSKTSEFVDSPQLCRALERVKGLAFGEFLPKSTWRKIHFMHPHRKKINYRPSPVSHNYQMTKYVHKTPNSTKTGVAFQIKKTKKRKKRVLGATVWQPSPPLGALFLWYGFWFHRHTCIVHMHTEYWWITVNWWLWLWLWIDECHLKALYTDSIIYSSVKVQKMFPKSISTCMTVILFFSWVKMLLLCSLGIDMNMLSLHYYYYSRSEKTWYFCYLD